MDKQTVKRTASPTVDMEFPDKSHSKALDSRVDSNCRAFAQAKTLERHVSRPGTPTSNASTDTPTSEQNDVDDDLIDVDDDNAAMEIDCSQLQIRNPFEILIAAAMERNPTQFQLPNELTCTTALPGEGAGITTLNTLLNFLLRNIKASSANIQNTLATCNNYSASLIRIACSAVVQTVLVIRLLFWS